MQNHHSLVYREEEREMFPTLKVRPPPPSSLPSPDYLCSPMKPVTVRRQMYGVGAIPWSPLGRGVLTRPLSVQTKRSETDACVPPPSLPLCPRVHALTLTRADVDSATRTKSGPARPTSSTGKQRTP